MLFVHEKKIDVQEKGGMVLSTSTCVTEGVITTEAIGKPRVSPLRFLHTSAVIRY
jgi:hypothetical protein